VKFQLTLCVVFLFTVNYVKTYADIITAASCSREDVFTAINTAIDGDTVIVPAGSAVWSDSIVIDPVQAVVLRGMGVNQTIITDSTPVDGWKCSPLWLYGEANKPFRITGFAFRGIGGIKGVINVNNFRNIRIDSCNFELDERGRALVCNNTYGVIDHCTFIHGTIAVTSTGDEAWTQPYAFGSANALFVEDCSFEFSQASSNYGFISGHTGCNWVLRYCTILNGGLNNHGTCTSPRSGMTMEVYNNTWTCNIPQEKTPLGDPITLRGGTGVIFNNTFTGYKVFPYGALKLINYRSCYTTCTYPYPNTKCDGTDTCDGNEDSTGYPCLDQIGRAANQVLEPAYEWNNITDSADMDFVASDEGLNPQHIKEGRDFYNDTERPGYTPFTYPHPLTLGLTEIIHANNSNVDNTIKVRFTGNGKMLLCGIEGVNQIQIFDVTGKQIALIPVFSKRVSYNFSDNEKLGNGCYILYIEKASQVIIKRFILSR
jgi:hypothetical protein